MLTISRSWRALALELLDRLAVFRCRGQEREIDAEIDHGEPGVRWTLVNSGQDDASDCTVQ